MRRLMCFGVLVLVIAVPGSAQQEGTETTGPLTALSVDVPTGWQSVIHGGPADRPSARALLPLLSLPGDLHDTESIGLWWDAAGETPEAGAASVHRLEGAQQLDAKALLDVVQQGGKLPESLEVSITQVGSRDAVLGGGTMPDGLFGAFVLIPAGRACYVATILGPDAAVTPQWDAFMDALTSLKIPAAGPSAAGAMTPNALGWGPDDQAYPEESFVSPEDGAQMVWVPAGEFTMGCDKDDAQAQVSEKPAHAVMLPAYWIGKTEVTNEQYGMFLEWIGRTGDHSRCHENEPAGKDHTPSQWADAKHNGAQQPVVGLDWFDAYAYAAWAGGRLPTEAEWEKAARGTDGRKYPWGNDWGTRMCNSRDAGNGAAVVVGSYPWDESPYGCLDMAGNAVEWCRDWSGYYYYRYSRRESPTGAIRGDNRLARGGCWGYRAAQCRATSRITGYADAKFAAYGFRVARTPQSGGQPEAPQPSAQAREEAVREAVGSDGIAMVYVPGGEFTMGGSDEESDTKPAHRVILSPYWVSKTEVTREQYGRFLDWITKTRDHSKCFKGEPADQDHTPSGWTDPSDGSEQLPVVGVDWYDAYAFAAWAGKRLPTEAEWEKAAQGTDSRPFPWGREWDVLKCNNHQSGINDITTVGSYPRGASPCGCLDMAGNVWEWCSDWYDGAYYANSPPEDPQGPASGETRVRRGGSWFCFDGGDGCGCAYRRGHEPYSDAPYTGFRVVGTSAPDGPGEAGAAATQGAQP